MQKSKKRYTKKILIGLAAALVVLASLSLFAVLWQGSTKDIEAVANSFTPPDRWTQTHYEIVPSKFICLSGRCPEIVKSWSYDGVITSIEMRKLIDEMQPTEITMGECNITPGNNPTTYNSCSGIKDGYNFSFFYGREEKDSSTTITLTIRRR